MATGWPLVTQCPSQFPHIPGLRLCSSSPRDKMQFDPLALVSPPVLLQTSLEWEMPKTEEEKKRPLKEKFPGENVNSSSHLDRWGSWNIPPLLEHQFLWRHLDMHHMTTPFEREKAQKLFLTMRPSHPSRSLLPFVFQEAICSAQGTKTAEDKPVGTLRGVVWHGH